jgi:hypothetical protein
MAQVSQKGPQNGTYRFGGLGKRCTSNRWQAIETENSARLALEWHLKKSGR